MNNNIYKPQKIDPNKLVRNFFNRKETIFINNAVHLGYYKANKEVTNRKWLSLDDDDLCTRIRTRAVWYCLYVLSKQKLIPCQFTFEKNKNNNKTFLLGHSNDGLSCFTVNQTRNSANSSRYAKYRSEKHLEYQSYFDFFNEGKLISNRPLYFELNYGWRGESPQFIVFGIPNESQRWYANKQLLPFSEISINTNYSGIKTYTKTIPGFSQSAMENFIKEL